MKIIWCMIPEILSAISQDRILLLSWAVFCTFTRPKIQKNKNFKKMKTTPGYIIIYHKCTQNYDHMLYCFWDKARDKGNCYFSFWAIFCPFTPLTAQKLKISKTYKKILDISFILASSVPCREVRDSWITEVREAIIIAVTISEGKDLHPFWSFKSFEYFAINFINLF